MKRTLLIGLLYLATPLLSVAQDEPEIEAIEKPKVKTIGKLPSWAPSQEYIGETHIYMRDYHTFYDPTRGYIYWSDTAWIVSRKLPEYLTAVDLKHARMQIINELQLNEPPEVKYAVYNKLYPAMPVEGAVPVPQLPK
jgi:hypothetical protein